MSCWNSCFQNAFFILAQNSTWNTLGCMRFPNAFKVLDFYTESDGCRIHWNIQLKNGPEAKGNDSDKYTVSFLRVCLSYYQVVVHRRTSHLISLGKKKFHIQQSRACSGQWFYSYKYSKWGIRFLLPPYVHYSNFLETEPLSWKIVVPLTFIISWNSLRDVEWSICLHIVLLHLIACNHNENLKENIFLGLNARLC